MEISFVVPVYNAEKTIQKCIDSIIANINDNGEIICIDDGSTDTSLSILKKYESQYPFIKVISKINEGPYIARKIGIENASKDYITFVDSDDWIEDTYISKINDVIQKNDTDIVLFEYINDFKNKKSFVSIIPLEERLYFDKKYKNTILPLLMGDGYLNGMCNKVFKRNLFTNNVRKEFRYNYGEDLVFQLDIFNKAKSLYFLPKSLYHYTHFNENSLSNTKQTYRLLVDMYELRNEYLKKWELNNERLDKPFLNLICMCFLSSFRNSNIKEMLNILTSIQVTTAIKNIQKIDNESKRIKNIFKLLKRWFFIYEKYLWIKNRFFYVLRKTILPIDCFFKRLHLKNDNFTILTSTCAGGIIYHRLGKKFMSPTINLWMTETDLLKFVSNIEKYQKAKLEFFDCKELNYPVAKLDDITIYFNHVKTEKDAIYQWEHRKDRINRDNLFILTSDYGLSYDEMIKFSKIKCKGLAIFTAKKYLELDFTLHLEYLNGKNSVGEYMSDHTKILDKFKWEKYFDYVYWLNTGKLRKK